MYMNIAHELQRQQLVNAYNKAVKRKDWKSAKNYRDELSILIAQKNMYENHLRTKWFDDDSIPLLIVWINGISAEQLKSKDKRQRKNSHDHT